MLIFQTEQLQDVLDFAKDVAQAHWDEAAAKTYGGMLYHLNIEQYAKLEQLGMLHISTARDANDDLCGYVSFSLVPCPHREDKTIATLDALYLTPIARKGFNALNLLKNAEHALKLRGASVVQYASGIENSCASLFKRLGASLTEIIYCKEL